MRGPVDGMRRLGDGAVPETANPAAPFEVETLRLRSTRVGGVEQTDEYGRIRNGRHLARTEGSAGSVRLTEYLSAIFPGTRYAVDTEFGEQQRVMSYRTEPEARVEYQERAAQVSGGSV